MNQDVIAVAIDGPAGAGKSTVARAVAQALGFVYVDTGALYRTIGLAVCRRGLDGTDVPGVLAVLPEIQVTLAYQDGAQHVLLDGEDVSDAIRTPQISTYASQVSSVPAVRAYLLDLQRNMARRQSVVMDGRDIGTVILPDAQVKIFLTASPETRAARRFAELKDKGTEPVSYARILEDMKARDALDASRAVAPLKQAPDAVLLDTSEMTLDESIQAALSIVRRRIEGE